LHFRSGLVTRAFQVRRYRCRRWQLHEEEAMFTELKEELLDLRVTEKGYRNALYASKPPGGCSGSSSSTGSSSSLTCCNLSWN